MGYFLASGAFATKDYWLSGMSLKKCFTWGYFPEVKEVESVYDLIDSKGYKTTDGSRRISIMWAGRLINWKHPEAAVTVAKQLLRDNIDFSMSIIGNGKLEDKIGALVAKNNLGGKVKMLGAMNPREVRKHMEKADIFLFTSDRHEGWGAVLNECLNSACAVVASNAVGSVPCLVKNGINGMIYECGKDDDLYRKVRFLIDNPETRKQIQVNAYNTILNEWNPTNASHNLIQLFEALLQGSKTPIKEGPGSQASLLLD